MVESIVLDNIFMSLADCTRRSILARVAKTELSIGEIAKHYQLTFAAVSKHINVLEKAGLVTKQRRGKEKVVIIVPDNLNVAKKQIEAYANIWGNRFDRLEKLLKEMENE
ncbi:MAG: metalloregulator ArsR/SmtB family transcription factor [Acidimicrobiia bacterium]